MMFVEGKYIIILIANVSKSGMSQILLTGLLSINNFFYRNINIAIFLFNSCTHQITMYTALYTSD